VAYNVHVLSLPDVDVADLPTVDVDVVDLPTVDVDVNSLPDLKISEVGPVGPVTLAGIPDRYTVAISSLPDLNLRIREIPSVRAHVPANFRLGLSILGVELAALHLCGEAQVITEPWVPNPCERCGTPRRTALQPPGGVSAVLRLKNDG
jgi:hypothetical protein